MIRHIVFDMGNVLCTFDEDYIINQYTPKKEEAEGIKKALFDSGLWGKLDKGTITYEQVGDLLKKELTEEVFLKGEALLATWQRHMPVDSRMEKIVVQLKDNGYHLYLLSNASVRFTDYQKTTKIFEHFDGFIVSAFHQEVKPEKRIYEILFNTYHLIPSECVFIDDKAENIATAEELGMAGHVFDGNVEDLYAFFEKNDIHYGQE